VNEPKPNLQPIDDDVGPLDEHGQQIWSPETEAAMARVHADPEYWAGIEEAEADIAAGRVYTSEEVEAHFAERKRRWLAEHNL
jgi:predicted transcriptional regulator